MSSKTPPIPAVRPPGYAARVDPAPSASGAKKPSSPPGTKRARHKRWTRATLVLTVVVIVGFGAALAWALTSWFRESPEADRIQATRVLLHGIAAQVGEYNAVYAHLPENLQKLRDPALTSKFEAQPRDPWDTDVDFSANPDGKGFRLRSRGPDKTADTADDIVVAVADVAGLPKK
jgi:type II secretory pathway pseudopilin PulG